jgi:hypothetical protein
MTDGEKTISPLFLQLVISLESAAWYQMGKIASPITGKIERDLEQAKVSIDLLVMLQEKTKGNLLAEERQMLENAVYTLQINYVDELNKEPGQPPEAKPDGGEPKPGSEAAPENQ